MISPRHIRLMVAVTLAAASAVLVVATLNVSGTTSTPSTPIKARLLRRQGKTKEKPTAQEKAYLRAHAQEDKKEERVFENKIPGHLPIKVKLRGEKEKAAKDLANDRWHRDLEIEVKNTGEKPIYYLSIILEMPEIRVGSGALTLGVRYGEHTLFDGSKGQANPENIPIKPKESLILSIDQGQAGGWEIARARDKWPQPKKIVILFEELNFGDGTGFFGDNGTPWPLPKRIQSSSKSRFVRGNENVFRSHHSVTSLKKPKSHDPARGGESVSLWPTNFRLEELLRFDFEEEFGSQPPSCCPSGCRLVTIYDEQYCYYCPIVRRAHGVQCIYEQDGICLTVIGDSTACSDGSSCPTDITHPCGYTPPPSTPTPSPTPTPTPPPCDPAEKPNNSNCFCSTIAYTIAGLPPQWDCPCPGGTGANYINYPGAVGFSGCGPNRYNDGSDCCICNVQCPSGAAPNPSTCECPTPTPTATTTTGAGGNENGPPLNCTDYFWVWWVSYDGGETWSFVSEEWAGCW